MVIVFSICKQQRQQFHNTTNQKKEQDKFKAFFNPTYDYISKNKLNTYAMKLENDHILKERHMQFEFVYP